MPLQRVVAGPGDAQRRGEAQHPDGKTDLAGTTPPYLRCVAERPDQEDAREI
jgi:hypothetical protein